jgi:hypothetical protein
MKTPSQKLRRTWQGGCLMCFETIGAGVVWLNGLYFRQFSPVVPSSSRANMTKHATSVATTAWAVAWFFLTGANATTVIPPTFEEMTDRADLVFLGELASSRAELRSVGTNRVIFTMLDFETNEVLKWNADRSVKHTGPGARDMVGITRLV